MFRARLNAVSFGSSEPGHLAMAATTCGAEDDMLVHDSSIHSLSNGTSAIAREAAVCAITPSSDSLKMRLVIAWRMILRVSSSCRLHDFAICATEEVEERGKLVAILKRDTAWRLMRLGCLCRVSDKSGVLSRAYILSDLLEDHRQRTKKECLKFVHCFNDSCSNS